MLMFVLTGLFALCVALILTLFTPDPSNYGIVIELEDKVDQLEKTTEQVDLDTINSSQVMENEQVPIVQEESKSMTFSEAICVPGVISFGMSFFFVKFTVYSILLWLPTFLTKDFGY